MWSTLNAIVNPDGVLARTQRTSTSIWRTSAFRSKGMRARESEREGKRKSEKKFICSCVITVVDFVISAALTSSSSSSSSPSSSSIVWIIRSNSICLRSTATLDACQWLRRDRGRKETGTTAEVKKCAIDDGYEQPAGNWIIKLPSTKALSNLLWTSGCHPCTSQCERRRSWQVFKAIEQWRKRLRAIPEGIHWQETWSYVIN